MKTKHLIAGLLLAAVISPLAAQDKDFNFSLQTNPVHGAVDIILLGFGATSYILFTDLTIETRITDKFSVGLEGAFLGVGIFNSAYTGGYTDTPPPVSGYIVGITPQFIFYPAGRRMRGWFISLYAEGVYWAVKSYSEIPSTVGCGDGYEEPYYGGTGGSSRTESTYYYPTSGYYDTSSKYKEDVLSQLTLGTGVGTGYKWAWDNGFTMTVSFSVGKSIVVENINKRNTSSSEEDYYWSQTMLPVTPNLRLHMPLFDFGFAFLVGYSF